jgi:Flp pilus assembly protein CpaB
VENLLPRNMLKSRQGAIAVGIAALVLATILLLAYLNHYRNSVKSSGAPITVLVAKKFIPKGTTALSLAKNGLFEVRALPKEQLQNLAVTDPAVLHGQVALDDVYPGQQLTTEEFGASPTASALSGVIAGTWRAMSISLDAAHGIIPQAQTGDHVDVYVQVGSSLGLLLPNVLLLSAPNQAAEGTTAPASANYILRVPTDDAPRLAYAAGNGTIWFVLRPQKGARPTRSIFVSGSNIFEAR